MRTNRILLSGPGLIGRKHAELIDASSRSELVAIVAPDHEKNIEFASDRGVPLFGTVNDALKADNVDAAIIASPNVWHAEQALQCIEAGIPALVEKPLTADLASAAEICRQAEARAVPVLVGHHRTYSGLLSAAKAFIQSQNFGALVAVQGSAMFRKPDHYFDEGPWRAQPGGGPIMINLIHDIGILQYLCGPVRSVSALASNARRGFSVEDTVAVSIVFENGALGTFLLSDIAASERSWELSSGENPAYPRSSHASCYHFAGTNGSLDFPTMIARYYGDGVTPSWWSPFASEVLEAHRRDPLARQLAHFEDVIAGTAAPMVSARMGLEYMRAIEAIRRATLSGTVVDLASVEP